jgi:hypothetical protein
MMRAMWRSVRYPTRSPARAPARVGLPLVVFSSLRGYRRSWVSADLLAAVTLLVIAVPE